jgi:hypothetical protein
VEWTPRTLPGRTEPDYWDAYPRGTRAYPQYIVRAVHLGLSGHGERTRDTVTAYTVRRREVSSTELFEMNYRQSQAAMDAADADWALRQFGQAQMNPAEWIRLPPHAGAGWVWMPANPELTDAREILAKTVFSWSGERVPAYTIMDVKGGGYMLSRSPSAAAGIAQRWMKLGPHRKRKAAEDAAQADWVIRQFATKAHQNPRRRKREGPSNWWPHGHYLGFPKYTYHAPFTGVSRPKGGLLTCTLTSGREVPLGRAEDWGAAKEVFRKDWGLRQLGPRAQQNPWASKLSPKSRQEYLQSFLPFMPTGAAEGRTFYWALSESGEPISGYVIRDTGPRCANKRKRVWLSWWDGARVAPISTHATPSAAVKAAARAWRSRQALMAFAPFAPSRSSASAKANPKRKKGSSAKAAARKRARTEARREEKITSAGFKRYYGPSHHRDHGTPWRFHWEPPFHTPVGYRILGVPDHLAEGGAGRWELMVRWALPGRAGARTWKDGRIGRTYKSYAAAEQTAKEDWGLRQMGEVASWNPRPRKLGPRQKGPAQPRKRLHWRWERGKVPGFPERKGAHQHMPRGQSGSFQGKMTYFSWALAEDGPWVLRGGYGCQAEEDLGTYVDCAARDEAVRRDWALRPFYREVDKGVGQYVPAAKKNPERVLEMHYRSYLREGSLDWSGNEVLVWRPRSPYQAYPRYFIESQTRGSHGPWRVLYAHQRENREAHEELEGSPFRGLVEAVRMVKRDWALAQYGAVTPAQKNP